MSDPIRASASSGASAMLAGIRILDLTRLLPGAYATLLLSDLGADVIKIEDPRGGDPMRTLGGTRRKPWFELLNRNKQSVTLNLRSPAAFPVLDALADGADVIVDSFKPATARKLGIDGESFGRRHPRLVCASITGFGVTGPYAARAAHDINYQALAGLLDETRLPQRLIADVTAAMRAAMGILAALFQRERNGRGSVVDVSIHEAALEWSMFPTTADLHGPSYTLYETADREWLALGALESKFWNGFCERLGQPKSATIEDVQRVIATRSRREWLAAFDGLDVCFTTVCREDELDRDPHLIARSVVERQGGVTYVTAPGVRVAAAPSLGAHTDGVLEQAGFDPAARARLRADGVI